MKLSLVIGMNLTVKCPDGGRDGPSLTRWSVALTVKLYPEEVLIASLTMVAVMGRHSLTVHQVCCHTWNTETPYEGTFNVPRKPNGLSSSPSSPDVIGNGSSVPPSPAPNLQNFSSFFFKESF
ncbi:hypothetical protein HAX54_034308 [Datura stramonium]|uniref:Uncharacterized protein n=1 Tax=Datura stramonium TaxID=4076 RepID=A0ABS8VFD6_DATST|nr:hypothetical protein [Datura stramonium]